MTDLDLSLARMHLLDGDHLDELRASYPELGFVFDKIDELRGTIDRMFDENRDLLGRIADLEDPQ